MSVREKFVKIASQRLTKVSARILELEGDAEAREEHLAALLRDLHTLKGEAGVLGLQELSRLSHALEDLFAGFQSGRAAIGPDAVDLCLECVDYLGQLVQGQGVDSGRIEVLKGELRGLLGDAPQAWSPKEARADEGMAQPSRELEARTLQVDPARLGHLSELVGDLLVLNERGGQRSQELVELLREIRADLPSHALPPWVPRLERLVRDYRHDTFLDSLRVQELSEQLRVLRLSPLTSLLEGYRRAVRDLARSLGKEAHLVVEAEAVEVDESVLRVLSDPLLHLVRNAIAHGIEDPAARVASNKPPAGEVRISVSQTGSHVEIAVSDDGAGIDPEHVAAVALERGLIKPGEVEALSDAQARELLFRPGFSTSALGQVSGRGVGLDVVRSSVEEHQGTLLLESKVGVGTRFVLRLPMNVAMGQALILTAAESSYAISAERVHRVVRAQEGSFRALGVGQGFRFDERVIPFRRLADSIEREPRAPSPGDPVVIVETRDTHFALGVDQIQGQRTVLFRPLDPFLEQLAMVQGSCVLADGSIALLLRPAALLEIASGSDPGSAPRRVGTGSILIAEDSPVTRELLLEILRHAGYRVSAAEDGLEALELIGSRRPDLVLTDLEMPRMNGVELTRRIRGLGLETPVVVVTTRSSDADRRACMQAGANAFVDKSQFAERELLDLIARLIE